MLIRSHEVEGVRNATVSEHTIEKKHHPQVLLCGISHLGNTEGHLESSGKESDPCGGPQGKMFVPSAAKSKVIDIGYIPVSSPVTLVFFACSL